MIVNVQYLLVGSFWAIPESSLRKLAAKSAVTNQFFFGWQPQRWHKHKQCDSCRHNRPDIRLGRLKKRNSKKTRHSRPVLACSSAQQAAPCQPLFQKANWQAQPSEEFAASPEWQYCSPAGRMTCSDLFTLTRSDLIERIIENGSDFVSTRLAFKPAQNAHAFLNILVLGSTPLPSPMASDNAQYKPVVLSVTRLRHGVIDLQFCDA